MAPKVQSVPVVGLDRPGRHRAPLVRILLRLPVRRRSGRSVADDKKPVQRPPTGRQVKKLRLRELEKMAKQGPLSPQDDWQLRDLALELRCGI